ncbi:MAG: hypothetical protein AB8H79_01635 [Myxococcota bacterium]
MRQLFESGCLQSAFWHRFTLTVHSPIAKDPDAFGIRILPRPDAPFASNDLEFEDPTGTDHDGLGPCLDRALYNYLHGVGLDQHVSDWFPMPVPDVSVPVDLVERALAGELA